MKGTAMTALVDLLFLLLFALLVLSDTRRADTDELVRVELPAVEPGAPGAGQSTRRLALEIDAASTVRFAADGAPVGDREALDRALAEAAGDGLPEEVAVELRADANARHGVAVDLLQHLRLRGFVRVELVAVGADELGGVFGAAAR